MKGQSMFYNLKNTVSAYVFVATLLLGTNVSAQGVVTLSEEAMFDENDSADIIPVVKDTAASDKTADVLPSFSESAAVKQPDEQEDSFVSSIVANDTLPSLESISANTSAEVFSKMSDLEKQTVLLNLELRKERVKNEIEAIKNQRKQAELQEKEKAEEKLRKKIEWEKTQEQKVLQEQQNLRELDIEFEKIRQEKLLNSYKNSMLSEHQEWIRHDASLHDQIKELKKQNSQTLNKSKNKIVNLKAEIDTLSKKLPDLIKTFKKELDNRQTQISTLKSRIEILEREKADIIEKESEKQNPFADEIKEKILSSAEDKRIENLYAVMEIRGQDGKLVAKLINQEGTPFYVKKGTVLQSGHTIEEITSTYVKAEKDGLNDYLYFAAGGILPYEHKKINLKPQDLPKPTTTPVPQKSGQPSQKTKSPGPVTSKGIPGLGTDMMFR